MKKKLYFVLLIGIIIGFFYLKFIPILNPNSDLWFLADMGRYIINNAKVPVENVFTIHNNFSLVVQQWMSCVVFYWVYSNFGIIGTFVLSIIAGVIITSIAYKYSGYFGDNDKVRMLSLLFLNLMCLPYLTTRPNIFTIIIFLSELCIVEEYYRTKCKKIYILLPILSLLQINFHASMWPFMFILLLPYITPSFWNLKKIKLAEHYFYIKDILFTMILMFIVAFINPNGIKAITYLLISYSPVIANQSGISELLAPEILGLSGICILIVVGLFIYYLLENKDRLDSKLIYMTLGTMILASKHNRNLLFLIFCALPLFMAVFNDKLSKDYVEQPISKKIINIFAILFVGISTAVFSVNDLVKSLTISDNNITPINAVEYLKNKSSDEIILFTDFNNGAFMEWNGFKTYIDARTEIYQKSINGQKDIFSEFLKVKNGDIDYKQFVNEYKFTHLIAKKKTLLWMFLENSGEYINVVDSEEYSLFETAAK